MCETFTEFKIGLRKVIFHKRRFLSLLLISSFFFSTLSMLVQAQPPDGPLINVWYGSSQQFGFLGVPQPWFNILGNVSDPDGVSTLSYTLNGGANSSLTIGPDGRRLESAGDFNIDLAISDLVDGNNNIVITATDTFGNPSEVTVTVDYDSGNVWPLPYTIDWNSTANIQDVAQVVDGLWNIEGDNVRTTIPGYDRLIAIGDVAWDDYEVTVPITIHSGPSSGGVGVLMRWNGHTDNPISGTQPKSGYLPLGAIDWYRNNGIEIYGNGGEILARDGSRTLVAGVTYIFKMRVETVAGVGGLYSFKVWEEGTSEPLGWDLTGQEELTDPQNGSMMLISYEMDASFGDVTITRPPFDISNIQVERYETSAIVRWMTNEDANSSVAYGLTSAYEYGSIDNGTLVAEHAIPLSGLTSNTTYHYEITSVNSLGDSVSSGDLTFRTRGPDLSGIVSDDFNTCTLNTDLWTFIDPVGDGAYDIVGTNTENAWLSISVPEGSDHDVWEPGGNKAPRIMQPANDEDFEIEVKFESPLTLTFQMQGIIIEEDNDNFLRFEFHSHDSSTRMFWAIFSGGAVVNSGGPDIASTGVAPLYMRITRDLNQWTQSYSLDGMTWNPAVSFEHVLSVSMVGVYAANAVGSSSPAQTGYIDYFFNKASPIDPEDGEEIPCDDPAPDSIIVSDDFNSCTLNDVWEFIDPTSGGSSYEMNGTNLQITVPGGASHEMYTSGMQAPRIIQPANDVDFEIEVKFDSPVVSGQEQGIVIIDDDANFLRFEFFGGSTNIFSAILITGSIITNQQIDPNSPFPLWMRVKRTGDMWYQTYSFDGVNWLPNTDADPDPEPYEFQYAMNVTAVGVYAGTYGGGSAPGHIADFDYFFNTASPIDPEDEQDISCESIPGPCPEGLVAYWMLDEGSGTTASDSYDGYNGTVSGATWTTGKVNNALSFDGNDLVDCGDINELNSVSEFTIVGWIKETDNTANERIFDKYKDGNYDISVAPFGGSLYFELGNSDNSYGYWSGYSSTIPSGEWYHLAAVYNGSGGTNAEKIKIYVNDVDRTLAFSGTIPSITAGLSGYNFTLSPSARSPTVPFIGTMDDVAIFNRSLSASEIHELYLKGVNGDPICEEESPPVNTTTTCVTTSTDYTTETDYTTITDYTTMTDYTIETSVTTETDIVTSTNYTVETSMITETDMVTETDHVTETNVTTISECATDTIIQTSTETVTQSASTETATTTETATETVYAAVEILSGDVYVDVGGTNGVTRGKPAGTAYAAWIDSTAGGVLLGMAEDGVFFWDTDLSYVDPSTGEPTGVPGGATLVASGGPLVNGPVKYYEANRATEDTPAYYGKVGGLQSFLRSSDDSVLAGLNTTSTHDLFIIEIFTDSQGRTVIIVYGLAGRGTLAGALYFVENVDYFNGKTGYWIYEWIDNPTDGTQTHPDPPGTDIYTQIATAP
jgi:hypothetical protein